MKDPPPPKKDDDMLDITDLVRRCASQCLSYSHPFTPVAIGIDDRAASLLRMGNGDGNSSCTDDTVADGTLLKKLQIRGTAVGRTSETDDRVRKTTRNLAPLVDLQDAMTALELGDKRMDCCEIPYQRSPERSSSSHEEPTGGQTFPPRIAPQSLRDTTSRTSLPSIDIALDDACAETSSLDPYRPSPGTLLLPTTPSPCLLPHWNNLRLSSPASASSLVSLLILQLTALEAYIGTNNGGSNAAETLYCMLWCHDGVLMDMADQLSVETVISNAERKATNAAVGTRTNAKEETAGEEEEELHAARWALFASSLGVIRIAEAVRWAVVNADFYEEEDFGVALHGGKGQATMVDEDGEKMKETQEEGTRPIAGVDDSVAATDYSTTANHSNGIHREGCSPSSMRFCPALQGSEYVNMVWDTALQRLSLFRSYCITKGCHTDGMDKRIPIIDILETVLRMQQSFFQSITILSNLNDDTVCNFTSIAVERSRETVTLLEKLCDNDIVDDLFKDGLVMLDGRLLSPSKNLLLSASFDPFVNRRLLGNSPVRKTCFRPPLQVMASLSQVAAELEWGVCDLITYGNTFGRIVRMLERNSLRGCGGAIPVPKRENMESSSSKKEAEEGLCAKEAPIGMNILSRSLIVLNLYFDDKLLGQFDFANMIGKCLCIESARYSLRRSQYVNPGPAC